MNDEWIASSALKHVHHLAHTIGPRGSATPQEAQAAEYARIRLENVGLQPSVETLASAKSAWRPYAMASAVALMAEILFLFAGQVGAILASLLMLTVVVSIMLELTFRDNPLRWILPKGQSQNVWARIPASNTSKQRVVLIGHLDTHRTPKLFSTPLWLGIFQILFPVGLSIIMLNALLFVIGIFSPTGWWRSLSTILALVPWWISVLAFEADYTPYTAGANDNASGVGVVLSLAAQLKQQALEHTEVWVLCSGCKEVGGYGAAAFFARHRDELAADQETYCIILDSIGGKDCGPCYISRETLLSTLHSSPDLLRLAHKTSLKRPELGAYSKALSGGAYTEARMAACAGLRVLPFVNLDKNGLLPHWHQASDIYAHVDGVALQKTEAFVWELLQALDKQNIEQNNSTESLQAGEPPI